jgi:hypothetical protein
MLRQEELAFFKALGNIEVSPLFLRELRKAITASKRRKAAASRSSKASGTERPSGVGGEARPHATLLQSASGKLRSSTTRTARLSQLAADLHPDTSMRALWAKAPWKYKLRIAAGNSACPRVGWHTLR